MNDGEKGGVGGGGGGGGALRGIEPLSSCSTHIQTWPLHQTVLYASFIIDWPHIHAQECSEQVLYVCGWYFEYFHACF